MADRPTTPRYGFGKAYHLRSRDDFARTYEAKVARHAGPLRVYGRPNGLEHSRLGLSVSRAVGTAVIRNRIKRMLRETFRLLQHDLPIGYDLVVVVRRHEPLGLNEYQRLFSQAAVKVHRHWSNSCSKN